MTLQAYLDSLKEKTVAVIGIGVSNTPLIRLLAESGVSVTACDRKERSQPVSYTHLGNRRGSRQIPKVRGQRCTACPA